VCGGFTLFEAAACFLWKQNWLDRIRRDINNAVNRFKKNFI
jgi:hypothetical protein